MPPNHSQQNHNSYDANQIVKLVPSEHVRKLPGMYIGGTDKRALHQTLWEVLDDAISEFKDTVYNEIMIVLLADKTICVRDNGLGIPLDINAGLGIPWLEAYMTIIGQKHESRQREKSYGYYYVGVSAVNALSAFCEAEVKREGFLWRQRYCEGFPTSSLEKIRSLEIGESKAQASLFSLISQFLRKMTLTLN